MNIDINALSRAELDALLKAAKKQQKILAKRAPYKQPASWALPPNELGSDTK